MIKLFSVYSSENSYYLVFELFSGGNLGDYIKQKGPLNEAQASFILRNLLEGIKYIHSLNIMHRDIKPDNILFRTANIYEESQIAIADFGLASLTNLEEFLLFRCGTPGYVAPEVLGAKKNKDYYSSNCDLFSLGVTLVYMLIGTTPYDRSKDLILQNKECKFALNNNKRFQNLSENG